MREIEGFTNAEEQIKSIFHKRTDPTLGEIEQVEQPVLQQFHNIYESTKKRPLNF